MSTRVTEFGRNSLAANRNVGEEFTIRAVVVRRSVVKPSRGASAVLVGTAIHEGRMGRDELARCVADSEARPRAPT